MWLTEYRCKECDVILPWSVLMNSHGTCPSCGQSEGATVISHTKRAYRWRYEKPERKWWEFWKPLKRRKEYRDESEGD